MSSSASLGRRFLGSTTRRKGEGNPRGRGCTVRERQREGNEGLARSRAEEGSRWQKKKERRGGKNKGWRRGFRREEGWVVVERRSGVSTLACEIHTGGGTVVSIIVNFPSEVIARKRRPARRRIFPDRPLPLSPRRRPPLTTAHSHVHT